MQKLRKKAGMVSTDAVDVYVGVADASAPSSFQSLLAGVLEAQVRGKEKIVLWLSGALSVDLVGGLFSPHRAFYYTVWVQSKVYQ